MPDGGRGPDPRAWAALGGPQWFFSYVIRETYTYCKGLCLPIHEQVSTLGRSRALGIQVLAGWVLAGQVSNLSFVGAL